MCVYMYGGDLVDGTVQRLTVGTVYVFLNTRQHHQAVNIYVLFWEYLDSIFVKSCKLSSTSNYN